MRIGDLADKSGLSTDTLRYYEKIGLIPRPLRDAGGRRVYDRTILRWIEFLDRLKATGMGIRDRLRYAELRTLGSSSLADRRSMLETHRDKVAEDIVRLTETLHVLDDKVDLYRRMEAGETVDPAFESCARTEHAAPPNREKSPHDRRTGARPRADNEA
ncbi:MerR family transcriptional regulator [Labrenzia sp. 011]|uniref:MerR family transcriptional regulator n=1 Tax=Labrenzia sp. 011 TaxID=2171494 RepID=UPI000D52095A|nr:MerR family transcriptional regulator [Labrenzia sp. 011]PVB59765.1 MerR family transcriptional regulator [Labrenzia sp. 011]